MRAKVWFSGKTFLRKRPLHSCASKICTLALSIKPAARFYGSHEMSKTFLVKVTRGEVCFALLFKK